MNVTDGKRVDWSDKGVPAHIEVYELAGCVVLYDRAKGVHVACKAPPPPWWVDVAVRQLEGA